MTFDILHSVKIVLWGAPLAWNGPRWVSEEWIVPNYLFQVWFIEIPAADTPELNLIPTTPPAAAFVFQQSFSLRIFVYCRNCA